MGLAEVKAAFKNDRMRRRCRLAIEIAMLILLYVFLAYKLYFVAKLFGLVSASSFLAGVPWG